MRYILAFYLESMVEKRVGRNGSGKHLNPNAKRARVFSVYPFSNKSQIALIRNQKVAGILDFTDYSIKTPYDKRWKHAAEYGIKNSDAVMVCYNSSELGKGSLFEIKRAEKHKKHIFAVPAKKGIDPPKELVKRDKNCRS